MYTVKNKDAVYTVIEDGNQKNKYRIVRIYMDNLAIEVATTKDKGGY